MKKIKTVLLSSLFMFSTALGLVNTTGLKDKISFENDTSAASETTINMKQIAGFLNTKEEHYPLSDEFIEKYQQNSGGYIELAQKSGLLVDKAKHEPNQKWHFFESWLNPKIEDPDDSLKWDSDAKQRVYTNLLCPELLLWIYEACEVAPEKVKAAKESAEADKVKGASSTSMAKNMRSIVSWDDLTPAILRYIESHPDGEEPTPDPNKTYTVSYNQSNAFTISGLENEYKAGDTVSFSIVLNDETKLISAVKMNSTTLTAISENNYSFTMPASNVTLTVTLKNKPGSGPAIEGSVATYNIKYDLGTRTTAKELTDAATIFDTFELSGGNELITEVSAHNKVYGGGHGGTGENKWYSGNLLKFGTTSVVGTLTLSLTSPVNQIIITGYAHKTSGSVRVGDSTSGDWTGASDGMTDTQSFADMSVASLTTVPNEQTSTLTFNFESTTSVTIATVSACPLYIASIEFINATNN
jgi:hypothetical protein